jgi:2-polyprenyl-3-methyl-5-hydroxy-6-metoxy-1,4-benzoquinol methylase
MDQFKKLENVDICDVCGSRNIAAYYRDSDIVICLECNFLFVSPRPSIDDIKTSYSGSTFYNSWISESEGRLKLWNKRFKRIRKYLKSASNVLDFSAGIGTFLQIAKDHGHKIYGTELSESAKEITLKQYNIKLVDTNYYFNENYLDYFDVITAWHVVEHVESPKKVLTEFYKILNVGGYLIIAVPNANVKYLKRIFRQQKMEQVFPKLRAGDEIHLSHFTEDTLIALLKAVGFHILEVSIDDHYALHNLKNRTMHYFYEFIRNLTHNNISPTIFIAAQK